MAADEAVLNKVPKNSSPKTLCKSKYSSVLISHWLAWGYEGKKNPPIEASHRRLPEHVFRVISDFIE
jgi:hypothetical protein